MLLFRKKYKSIFWLLPLTLFYRYELLFFPQKNDFRVGEIFLTHLFGGSYHMEKPNLIRTVDGLIGIIVLTLLFADYIVCDLTESAEYIFSRNTNRRKWYLGKCKGLFWYCALGIFLYIIYYIWAAWNESQKPMDGKDVLLILCTYVMLFLFTYCSMLFLNLLILYHGTTVGYVVYYSIVIAGGMLMVFTHKIPDPRVAGALHLLNPMSNLLVSWNFGNYRVLCGLVYYVALAAVAIWFLWREVKRYEIGIGKKRKSDHSQSFG